MTEINDKKPHWEKCHADQNNFWLAHSRAHIVHKLHNVEPLLIKGNIVAEIGIGQCDSLNVLLDKLGQDGIS